MKLLQQQFKNILGAVLVLVFAVAVSYSLPVSAAPGDATRIPLNPGNEAQPLQLLRVGDTQLQDVGFDVSGIGDISSFARPGSLMVIFGNLLSTANNYLGDKGAFQIVDGFNTVNLPTQSMNIDGTLLATSLNHAGDPAQRPLCVGSEGILFLCENQGPTPQWQTGPWGACVNGSQTRTVLCMEGDEVVSDSECTEPRPADTQSCGNYNWVPGRWGPCILGTQFLSHSCQDENGTIVADSLCSEPEPNISQSCGGEVTPPDDTYSWNIGTWSLCTNGTETRTVTCEDQDGNTVADNLCPDPDPIESQACDTFNWVAGPWGICDTGSGGTCSGEPDNNTSYCSAGAQLGSFPTNPPAGYSYVFSCATATSEAACQDTIQTLDANMFNNGDVRYCEWEEPAPDGVKVDWNGDPFNWDPTFIYATQGVLDEPLEAFGIQCAVTDPDDAASGSCIGYITSALPNSGSGVITGEYMTVIPSGPNTGSWYPVSLQYGPCNEGGFGCGTLPMGGGQDGNSALQEFIVESAVGNAYGTGNNNISCVRLGGSQANCEAVPGCVWTPQLGAGTQIRSVTCQNQDGDIVDDSLCTDARPEDAQNC
jgi:hypothetical protein